MSRAKTAIVIIALLSLTASTGFIPFASAFVNIVSPSKGEPVPAGSSLEISGTSNDNAQTNCKIQVIVNDKRPYQETTPVGPGDYSKWVFIVTPQYSEIEEGINKITSKAICDAAHEPFLVQDPITKQYVKHYSINVTGVPSGQDLIQRSLLYFQHLEKIREMEEGMKLKEMRKEMENLHQMIHYLGK